MAALAWPALAAVPYLLLLLFGLLQWSGGKGDWRSSPQGCRMLQLYTSAYDSVVLVFRIISHAGQNERQRTAAAAMPVMRKLLLWC